MDGNLTPAPAVLSTTVQVAGRAGRVVELSDGAIVLSMGSHRVAGRRATSCLVEPAPGDLVLTVEADGETYVLAVLDRTDGAGAVLSVPGASSATLSQDQLALRCDSLNVDAGHATLRSRVAQVAGRTLNAVAERLDVVARTLRRTADHEFSHAKTATRTVDGMESVTAGELMLEGRSVLAQRAGIVLVDAREDVRVNGERITMG
jgi:hypothetical protein